MTTAIIVCGGSSSRISSGENKLLFWAHGKHLIEYTVSPFLQSTEIDKVIIVKPVNDKVIDEIFKNQEKVSFANSGNSRTQSVYNGLIAAIGSDFVLIHDGARPYVSQKIISDCITALKTADSAVAAVHNVDTLKKGSNGMLYANVDRDLLRIQTPQGFNYSKLIAAYKECCTTETDDSEIFFKKYGECKYFISSDSNKKITFSEDLIEFHSFVEAGLAKITNHTVKTTDLPNVAGTYTNSYFTFDNNQNENNETYNYAKSTTTHKQTASYSNNAEISPELNETNLQIFANSDYRVGTGFDAHRFSEGRKLILGGVIVPHTKGLLGHSDADVLAHAVMDAVLSALSQPDIGNLFPDTDKAFKDADSMELLNKVVKIMQSNGYELNNLSAAIIAQSPKLNMHIPNMVTNLSAAFNCQPSNIGISATTTEHLGFYDKDGIGCNCVLSLIRKK